MNIRLGTISLVALIFFSFALPAFASETSGTVLDSQKFGWGDKIGWINFAPTDGSEYVGLVITDSAVTGFAWSRDFGWIRFDPPNSGQGVTNTPEGVLGGSAWVASLGWISMEGVTINQNGEFTGIAGVAGTDTARISFDCSRCGVQTDWRPASVRGGGGNNGGGSGNNGRSGSSVPDASSPEPSSSGGGIGIVPFFQNLFTGIFGAAPGTNAGTAGAAGAAVPNSLFDISLALEKSVVPAGEPLVALVSFANFGKVTTAADLAFSIVNGEGTVFATSTARTSVETENLVRQTFATTAFSPGTYWIKLRVTYGSPVITEDFNQQFTITAAQTFAGRCGFPWPLSYAVDHIAFLAWFGCVFPWIIIIVTILMIVALFYYLVHPRGKDRHAARAFSR
ncbi:MAG: hypothetical protein WDN10_04495 [bacterium]